MPLPRIAPPPLFRRSCEDDELVPSVATLLVVRVSSLSPWRRPPGGAVMGRERQRSRRRGDVACVGINGTTPLMLGRVCSAITEYVETASREGEGGGSFLPPSPLSCLSLRMSSYTYSPSSLADDPQSSTSSSLLSVSSGYRCGRLAVERKGSGQSSRVLGVPYRNAEVDLPPSDFCCCCCSCCCCCCCCCCCGFCCLCDLLLC